MLLSKQEQDINRNIFQSFSEVPRTPDMKVTRGPADSFHHHLLFFLFFFWMSSFHSLMNRRKGKVGSHAEQRSGRLNTTDIWAKWIISYSWASLLKNSINIEPGEWQTEFMTPVWIDGCFLSSKKKKKKGEDFKAVSANGVICTDFPWMHRWLEAKLWGNSECFNVRFSQQLLPTNRQVTHNIPSALWLIKQLIDTSVQFYLFSNPHVNTFSFPLSVSEPPKHSGDRANIMGTQLALIRPAQAGLRRFSRS